MISPNDSQPDDNKPDDGKKAGQTVYHHDDAGNVPAHGHHDNEVIREADADKYWRENIRLLLILMAVWFVASFGCGILFVDQLNQFSLGGFKLGFWFAQQGSIFVFVGLIFIYAFLMKRIERRYGVDDDD